MEERPPRYRRWWWTVWILACFALVVLALIPVADGCSRLAMVANASLVAGIGIRLWWSSRPVRVLAVALVLAVLGIWLLPARDPDAPALRERYRQRLAAHVGTVYVWGGEGVLGLDCSGLVRRAFMEANLIEGLRRADAGGLRRAAWLWWHDQSARCLRDGGLGSTQVVGDSPRLADVPADRVQPGDLAVTRDGVHVLATLGGGCWIQASPGRGRVIVTGPGDDDPWLSSPVRLVRWQALDVAPSVPPAGGGPP